MNPWAIGGAVAGGIGLVVALLFGGNQWLVAKGRKALAERFPPGELLLSAPSANGLGLESRGRWQIRGNGALAVTSAGVWFRASFYSLELDLPLRNIRSVELVDSHLGKMIIGRKLLKIHFVDAAGTADSVAFLVREPAHWQAVIERARATAGTGP